MKQIYDINWHNVADEMPGTDYEYRESSSNKFVVRCTFEDEEIECFYDVAILEEGKFIPCLHNWDEGREEARKKLRILQWAFLDHQNDYD